MQIISSYGVELRKQNIPIRQTLEIYRSAVSYLIGIYVQVWEELAEIPDAKRRFNAAEHLVHTTKKNHACFDFDIRFPKMPSYLRRSAIQHALGTVSSYKTRLDLFFHRCFGKCYFFCIGKTQKVLLVSLFQSWSRCLFPRPVPAQIFHICVI